MGIVTFIAATTVGLLLFSNSPFNGDLQRPLPTLPSNDVLLNNSILENGLTTPSAVLKLIQKLEKETWNSGSESLQQLSVYMSLFLNQYQANQVRITFFPDQKATRDQLALYNWRTRTITLNPEASQVELAIALIHELTHYGQFFGMTTKAQKRAVEHIGNENHLKLEKEAFENTLAYYEEYVTRAPEHQSLHTYSSHKDIQHFPSWKKGIAYYDFSKRFGQEESVLNIMYE